MSGIIVIGASLGGLNALERVLERLPPGFGAPVLVVQHRADDNRSMLTSLLDGHAQLDVCEAEDKAELRPGRVLIAPSGYHALVERGHVELSTEEAVRFSRPSIDLAMETAAQAYGRETVGVVLTGANDDGSRGLAAIRRVGGCAIVQDPVDAERRSMPDAAIEAASPQWVLPLEEIGPRLVEIAGTEARR